MKKGNYHLQYYDGQNWITFEHYFKTTLKNAEKMMFSTIKARRMQLPDFEDWRLIRAEVHKTFSLNDIK